MKGCILPFPIKGDLRLTKNYRGITLTSIAAKIYNALLRNRIEPQIDNILRKNQNVFRRNRSTTSEILTIRRILKGVRAKNLQVTILFVDFSKAFDSIHRGKMEQILLLYFDPAKNAIPRWGTGRRWHILMAVMRGNRVGGSWQMKWDELKNSHGTLIDWCTGREWPVNCDSYFRLMKIKHSISKIEWAIVWALNYYITQSKRKSRASWSEMWYGKPHQAEVAWGPDELGSREDADKMQ